MAQNIGTLITSPIRPSDSDLFIASAYSNELKGGHHTYATLSERDSIISTRRQWNMLVTVYNDGANNNTYQLSYNFKNTTITDNGNWIIFNRSLITSDIIDIISVTFSEPISPSNNDTYLISDLGTIGNFIGHENQLAIYDTSLNSPYWNFITPSNGTEVKLGNNKIYRYDTSWKIEYQNQVRYIYATSSDGLSYTSNSITLNPLDEYNNNIFYTQFSINNNGTVSLSIDGLYPIVIKRFDTNTLTDLNANDLESNIIYQLVYNNDILQTTIISTGDAIGSAPGDGIYNNGLYSDFTPSTTIGTPIDRYNIVLKSLIPPSAPTLSYFNTSLNGFKSGYLGFDNSNSSFISATNSINPITKNGTYSIGMTFSNYTRLGIYSNKYGILDIIGNLNNCNGIYAYITNSFGMADSGHIYLKLNGNVIDDIDLSLTSSSIDDTLLNSVSGLSVSQIYYSTFQNGDVFDMYPNRTADWIIKQTDTNILNGWNYIELEHTIGGGTISLNKYEFVLDSSTYSSTASGVGNYSNNPYIGTIKYLSGIKWITSNYYILYNSPIIQNVYKNTFQGTISLTCSNNFNLFNNSVIYPSVYNLSDTYQMVGMTLSFDNSNKRFIGNEIISVSIKPNRTYIELENTFTTSFNGLLLDNVTSSSTNTIENFDDENYRLFNTYRGNSTYSRYSDPLGITNSSNIPGITSSTKYDSTVLIKSNFTNELQVYNSKLVYPSIDFSSYGHVSTNLMCGSGSFDYTNATSSNSHWMDTIIDSNAYRAYTRYFILPSSSFNPTITMTYATTSFVKVTESLLSNKVMVEIKLPYGNNGYPNNYTIPSDKAITGWLDINKYYNGDINSIGLNQSGCLATSNLGLTSGTWTLNLGVAGTIFSNNYILFRITAPPLWAGYIENVTINI